MLRDPYTAYDSLFVYYFDRLELGPVCDPDAIGTWVEDGKAILFFHREKKELVREICNRTGASLLYEAEIDYKDWEAGTAIQSFCSGSLHIRPVWERQVQVAEGSLEIVLDPSVIFGSGFHATTRMCLETLEQAMCRSKVKTILDLGTGTGLLAIAGAKLGAAHVTAVDNNPLACAVAEKNVALNRCGSRVEIIEADLLSVISDLDRFDLVIANLYRGLLLMLFEDSRFWQAGMHLLSGFMPGMEGDLLAALPRGIRVLHRSGRDNWRLWLLGDKEEGIGSPWNS